MQYLLVVSTSRATDTTVEDDVASGLNVSAFPPPRLCMPARRQKIRNWCEVPYLLSLVRLSREGGGVDFEARTRWAASRRRSCLRFPKVSVFDQDGDGR